MNDKRKTILVGGLPITPFLTIEQAVETVFVGDKVLPGFAAAVNAEKVVSALQNSKVKASLVSATLLFADGISVVKTIQKKGVNNCRIPGCELWVELVHKAARLDKHVYLLGGREVINQKVAKKLSDDFGLKTVSRRNGYYKYDSEVFKDLEKVKPEIVVVALGSPKQEELIVKLRECYPDAFYIGVGGAYDVFVGGVKRAPKIFQKLHLEWFFRLLSQPKRIFRQSALLKYAYRHYTNQL